ncbi:hypothetical protein [Luteolibacter luteus]|uniref:Uncharacterized protein n=1 Tax=Luteolibacter luteus TaxID=2728835 RepID=A0A858RJ16_9BACT|nr:hypothetical protein [Luteolibacter luteus]QJE96210.1 hypothetical protein HHL09_10575 [Luteolibacter luteus]
MKPSHTFGLVLLAIAATVAIEESRMAQLRAHLDRVEASIAKTPAGGKAEAPATASLTADDQPTRVRERPDAKPDATAKKAGEDDGSEDLSKTVRKMWENPAGRSMMNQGVKMAVAMMYGDFIDGLELSKEETEYFRNLLGQEMADQQEIGMKMMSASPEEQAKLAEEISKRAKDNEEEIKKFLNSEEDYKKFQAYKDRLPERQQLDGLRATMASKQVALDPADEEKLVEAMHRARTQPNVVDYSGAKGFEEISKGNAVEAFEQNWTRQQENLKKEVSGVLNEKQMEAFTEYQEQMKEFQLMGIKMVAGKKGQADEAED